MLFKVQDYDRPLWVIADSWQDAISAWKYQIYLENRNDGEPYIEPDMDEPMGVELVCGNDELLLVRNADITIGNNPKSSNKTK